MAFRGVNLGGWLVLEKWITPAVFEGSNAKDEYSLCLELGSEEASKRLQVHRDSFITRDIIRQLAESGLTMLRVPVGYWLFEPIHPFVGEGYKYIDWLFKRADEFDMQIILDVHAAPGSQNGRDHSGRAGKINWTKVENIEATLKFIKKLAQRYGHHPRLYGVEVLNEPHRWCISIRTLMSYYERSYQIIDTECRSSVKVIFSDAFRGEGVAKRLGKYKWQRAILDVHMYQLFNVFDRLLSFNGHLRKASDKWPALLHRLSVHLPVLVGEWSAALRTRKSYDRDNYVQYFEAQRLTFDREAIGWTYWTIRTQDRGVWSLLDHPEFLKK